MILFMNSFFLPGPYLIPLGHCKPCQNQTQVHQVQSGRKRKEGGTCENWYWIGKPLTQDRLNAEMD